MNWVKSKSFTLLEILISIILITIITSNFFEFLVIINQSKINFLKTSFKNKTFNTEFISYNSSINVKINDDIKLIHISTIKYVNTSEIEKIDLL